MTRWWGELNYPNACAWLAAVGAATSAGGFIAGSKSVFLALDAACAAPFFYWCLRRGAGERAAFALLCWGAAKVAAVVALTVVWPGRGAEVVAFGERYADGMLTWLRYAEGSKFDPGGALIIKVLIACAAASALSAGAAGLVVGAALVNCHGYYLGRLFLQTTGATKVLAFGTPIWYFLLAAAAAHAIVGAAAFGLVITGRRAWEGAQAKEALGSLAVAAVLAVAAFAVAGWLGPLWRDQLAPWVMFGE